ncbi:MAG: LamG domain-containing protein [Planctomycetaceae bacterium]
MKTLFICMGLLLTVPVSVVAEQPKGGASQNRSRGILPRQSVSGLQLTAGLVTRSQDLIAHWPLAGDAKDHSGNNRNALLVGKLDWNISGPEGTPQTAARFDGQGTYLEVPSDKLPPLGTGEFTLTSWVRCEENAGDILSQYDPGMHRGFHLGLKTQAVTTSQANDRHLHFGIDDNRITPWEDCGRPGNALLAFAAGRTRGELYAGTLRAWSRRQGACLSLRGRQDVDRLWCSRSLNSVTALAVFDHQLYAGTGKYRVAGSALPESQNPHLGGRIFRYAGQAGWIDCGGLPETEAIGGLIVFRGKLYASSLYRPAGFYRYEGEQRWVDCGVPDGRRVVALGVFNDALYATSYDGGHVYLYDGQNWTDLGRLGENTQTYSFAAYQGNWHVGTWPSGRVYRLGPKNEWIDIGRLGEELEVMGMLVHNGRFLAGTLPLAQVYSYEGASGWQLSARLDQTPDVKYRRAWTMAEHDGRIFCSTLPSGQIHACEVGHNAFHGHTFPSGWQHVAAVRRKQELSLYLNGVLVSRRSASGDREYDLTTTSPLRIGFGQNDSFHGALADVRLYGRALPVGEIRMLASKPE